MEVTQAQLIEAVYGGLPYPHQISNLELEGTAAVRFHWRQQRLRASTRGSAETVEGSFLVGDDAAILVGELIRRELRAIMLRAPAASTTEDAS